MQQIVLVNLDLFGNDPFFSQKTKDTYHSIDFDTTAKGAYGLATGIGGAVALADPNSKEKVEKGVAVTGNFLAGLGNTASAFQNKKDQDGNPIN